jgi:hypothetical protein
MLIVLAAWGLGCASSSVGKPYAVTVIVTRYHRTPCDVMLYCTVLCNKRHRASLFTVYKSVRTSSNSIRTSGSSVRTSSFISVIKPTMAISEASVFLSTYHQLS